MRQSNDETQGRRLRIGSLFSGYGGLDLIIYSKTSLQVICVRPSGLSPQGRLAPLPCHYPKSPGFTGWQP